MVRRRSWYFRSSSGLCQGDRQWNDQVDTYKYLVAVYSFLCPYRVKG